MIRVQLDLRLRPLAAAAAAGHPATPGAGHYQAGRANARAGLTESPTDSEDAETHWPLSCSRLPRSDRHGHGLGP
jgi:hypothetical protein